MKLHYLLIFIFLPILGLCQHENSNFFNEKYYYKVSKGGDTLYPYVITFKNKMDSNYKLKYVYFDSNYSHILSKMFFYKGKAEGPFWTYANNKVLQKGSFKNDNWD